MSRVTHLIALAIRLAVAVWAIRNGASLIGAGLVSTADSVVAIGLLVCGAAIGAGLLSRIAGVVLIVVAVVGGIAGGLPFTVTSAAAMAGALAIAVFGPGRISLGYFLVKPDPWEEAAVRSARKNRAGRGSGHHFVWM